MKIFIDTNIILDVIAERHPFYDASASIISLFEKDQAEGFVSAMSFNNTHYILRKKSGKNKALKAMRTLLDTFSVVSLDEKILSRTIDSGFNDFEDGIQFFSAMRCNADYLITRNIKDFPHQDIPVLTPEEFLALDLKFE
jgi:predicted nucleic acid-binding protein